MGLLCSHQLLTAMKPTIKRPADFDNDTLARIAALSRISAHNQTRFESMADESKRSARMMGRVMTGIMIVAMLGLIGCFVFR